MTEWYTGIVRAKTTLYSTFFILPDVNQASCASPYLQSLLLLYEGKGSKCQASRVAR